MRKQDNAIQPEKNFGFEFEHTVEFNIDSSDNPVIFSDKDILQFNIETSVSGLYHLWKVKCLDDFMNENVVEFINIKHE